MGVFRFMATGLVGFVVAISVPLCQTLKLHIRYKKM